LYTRNKQAECSTNQHHFICYNTTIVGYYDIYFSTQTHITESVINMNKCAHSYTFMTPH